MKKHIINRIQLRHIVYLQVLFLLLGCKYLFEPEEYYFSNIKTKAELTKAVDSVYDLINSYFQSTALQNAEIMSDDLLARLEGPMLLVRSTRPYWGYYVNNQCPKGFENFNAYINDWRVLYSIIASINNILSQFELETVNDTDARIMLAELVFYRAYFHYRLMLIYGRVPVVLDNDVNYALPKLSYSEIYEIIEHELKLSMQYLPQTKANSRIPYETPDRGCAKALLGEVYLSWAGYPANDRSKYVLAVKETGELIDSAAYYGYELLPDLYDVWSYKEIYTNEAIFCNIVSTNGAKLSKYAIVYYSFDFPSKNFSFDGLSEVGLRGLIVPEITFFNTYPVNYRKDITFYTRIYVDSLLLGIGTIFEITGLKTGFFDVKTTNACSRAAYRKFYIDTLTIDSVFAATPNASKSMRLPRVYLIRYAQTLLTYAEASARSGNLNERAYDCVNMVRRRANKLPLHEPSPFDLPKGLSPEAFADSVLQERAWELAGEPGHRWFDMVRTETVEKVFEGRDPNDGGPFIPSTNEKYFFPIPQGDINLNPNLGE